MKGLLLSCAIAFLSLGVVSATQDACTPGQAIPLLRAWNAGSHDHFYTTNTGEMINAVSQGGYSSESEGDAGRVFGSQVSGTVPLYRMYQPSVVDHFYTTDGNERNNAVQNSGYIDEGITGYIYPSASCGSVPFYRMYNPTVDDHFYTTDANEKNTAVQIGGYVDEGIAGYVLPV